VEGEGSRGGRSKVGRSMDGGRGMGGNKARVPSPSPRSERKEKGEDRYIPCVHERDCGKKKAGTLLMEKSRGEKKGRIRQPQNLSECKGFGP